MRISLLPVLTYSECRAGVNVAYVIVKVRDRPLKNHFCPLEVCINIFHNLMFGSLLHPSPFI